MVPAICISTDIYTIDFDDSARCGTLTVLKKDFFSDVDTNHAYQAVIVLSIVFKKIITCATRWRLFRMDEINTSFFPSTILYLLLARIFAISQDLIRILFHSKFLCIRTEIFSRHTNAHVRENSYMRIYKNLLQNFYREIQFILYMIMVLHVTSSLQCLLGACISHFYSKLLNLPNFLHSTWNMSFQIIFGCLE